MYNSIIGNAITRKCKLGMLTYITMDISVCPSEWYQSAKFRVLAHALIHLKEFFGFRARFPSYLGRKGTIWCWLSTVLLYTIYHTLPQCR